MSSFTRLSLVLLLIGASSAFATSEIPDLAASTVETIPGTNFMTPAGNGQRLDGADGSPNVTITVTMMCSDGPCILLPFQDIYVEPPAGSGLNFCGGRNVSSANTNQFGITTFSYQWFGGGWSEGPIDVYWAGTALPDGPIEGLRINSPDIDGNLVVDMADIGQFAVDLSSGYTFRSDFVADGVLDLADVGVMSFHLGETCP